MKNAKSPYSHQDGASFVLYEKIRIQPLRSSERMTLFDVDGNKAALAREYFQLGNEYFKKNDYKASISYFESSLKYSYQSPQTHNNLGVLLALISEEQLSLDYFKKSIQLRPKQIFAYINLANMQIKRGEYTSGIQLYLDLMTQYKEKRIMDNFNKIIKNYNNFYKYTKKYIRSAHRSIEPSTFQDILKLVLEYIPKDAPLAPQLLSPQNIVDETDIQKIKGTFETIKIMYSKLHWNYLESQFNKSIMYGKLLSQFMGNLDNKFLNLVVCLLLSYFFIEKEESSLSCYFNSLLDDGIQQIKHLKCYQQLSQNHINLKKIKLLPYLIQSKTSTKSFNPELQKREVINTIERLYFHKKLYIYQLSQLYNDQNKINNLNEKEIEILANSLNDSHQYLASKFLFQKYRQHIQSYFFDYLYQSNILELSKEYYAQNRIDAFNHQHCISQLDKELYSGECPISRQIDIASYKIQIYFEKKEYEIAKEICTQALKLYPQKSDKFYQYLGAIYLLLYSLEPSRKQLIANALEMWEKSIIANPKNDQSHFQQFCVLYQSRRTTAVKHLFRSLSIHPEKEKYIIQLAFVSTNSTDFQVQIKNFVAKLQKQYTKATDFKVKGNIALFHLYTENYDQSYTFFKKSMEEASKEDDTNCEDLLFMYFVNKLFWLYYHLVEEQHSFRFQLVFYLILFIKSPFLFEKYEEQTHLCDQSIYEQLGRDLAIHLQRDSKSLIQRIRHFDMEHKSILYPYIFKEAFKYVVSFDSVVFYAELKSLEQSLMENFWTYEIVAELKQQKILKIKQFITYISQKHQKDKVKDSRARKHISQQIKKSTFYKIRHLNEKRQGIILQLSLFKKRCFHLLRHIDTQIHQESILNFQDGMASIKTCQNLVTSTQRILSKLKYLEVICLIFQYFLCFLEQNPILKSFINKLCKKLLQNKNLDDMFFKLRNYIVEDYISSNSNISLFCSSNTDQQSQIKSLDDSRIDFSENSILQLQKISFIQQETGLRDSLPFYKLSIPQEKEVQIFLFAVKLVTQLEKQGFVLREISLSDFKIVENQIHFHGIKKALKVQRNQQKYSQKMAHDESNAHHHLVSLQHFFKEIQQNSKIQPFTKCRFLINLLFSRKIKYRTFITKVAAICRQIQASLTKRQLP